MPLSELQAVLARILTDEPVRQRFLEAGRDGPMPPELSGYGLSLPEWRQLGAICAERLNLYAHLLRDKRIAKLPDVLPWTWFLLGESLKWLVPLYCRDHLPATIRKFGEAQTFCRFLVEHASLIEPACAPDVARYEIMIAWFAQRRSVPARQGTTPFSVLEGTAWRELPAVSCTQTENAALVEFDHDLERILPFVQKSERPPESFPGKAVVLFRAGPEGCPPRTYAMQDSAAGLLRLCDGRRSLRDIVEESVSRHDASEGGDREILEEACVSILKRFLNEGIVELCDTAVE